MNRIFIILFLLLHLTVCSQVQVVMPKSFIETQIPKIFSDEWFPLNRSRNVFQVKIIDSKLDIQKVNRKHAAEYRKHAAELKLDNGKLIGINRGEWGGKLSFIPTDKNKKEIIIKEGNIKFVFSFNNKIYFIEGLAHLSIGRGAIFELKKDGETFSYKTLVEFDDAPEAFTIYKNKLLIATSRNFYIVEDFKKDLIFEGAFWSSLYPTSIAVVDKENVYLGIRSGLVKLNLVNKKMKFYKYTK